MSGSLSSLILIAVVWLLLLAPLFLRNQSPVRRTSSALSETRVLHEGGAQIDRPRKRPLPAESLYHADVDEDIELVEAEPEQVIIDDTGRDVPGIIEGEVVGYRPLDDEDTGEFAPVDPDAELIDGLDDDAGDSAGEAAEVPETVDAEPGDAGESVEQVEPPSQVESAVAATDDGQWDGRAARFSEIPSAYLRGGDIDVSVGTGEETDGESLVPGAEVAPPADFLDDGYGDGELTAEELDYAAARRGRGFYDPEASQRMVERRQTRRKRVLSVLAALCVVSVVVAALLGGAAWSAVVVTVALAGVYLYYLRRQVVEEARLRRRRIARMRRARLGVRNTDDRELGVPDRLLRPGAVVLESDDVDPEFADLDYGEYSEYSDYEEYDGYADRRVSHIRAV
ncbi:gephyrin-like molybdotransferase receptor GlpR [Corynebacterium sp.]|uniref:divisome protein SepX/GlpR n=1 Tax=Corynebacterium sp. TaxID=1720 RepID=UPI003B3AD6B3